MKTKLKFSQLFLLSAFCLPLSLFAQGTAFTYQGRLNSGASVANGSFDLQFAVYDAASGGLKQAPFITNAATAVSNGLFTVTLDFGTGVFPGAARWLDIGVRTNGGGTFTLLTPRQALTATPYAVFAGGASNLVGAVSSANLAGTYSQALTLNNPGNVFTGNGAGVTNVNAVTLNGLGSGAFWQLGGNNVASGQFLGSTNNQPVEILVNGHRTLRLEQNIYDAPNMIGGASVNYVLNGISGATISGGGATNFSGASYTNRVIGNFGTVGGGAGNTADYFSTVGGGQDNTAVSLIGHATVGGGHTNQAIGSGATVGGGDNNIAAGNGPLFAYATVSGGNYNTAGGDGSTVSGGSYNYAPTIGATIGGGFYNFAGGYASSVSGGYSNVVNNTHATVGGGYANTVNAFRATIAGGDRNSIQLGSDYTFIGGGTLNQIMAGSSSAVISGGSNNQIETNTILATISGGGGNFIQAASDHATIAGGIGNLIQPGASDGTIGGGSVNTIMTGSRGVTIGGGIYNTATNQYATIGGGSNNVVNALFGTVSGGGSNIANRVGATIGGGYRNSVVGDFAVIGGGTDNMATNFSTVSGGKGNTAVGISSTVGGGEFNAAGKDYSVVSGGRNNSISGVGAVISGGEANTSSGSYSVVVGGFFNSATSNFSTIGGGTFNFASGNGTTIGGGHLNTATNIFATVPGGQNNTAGGVYSFAAGQRAKAVHNGSYVWSDYQSADFSTTSSNQFLIRAGGGVGINTSNPVVPLTVEGSGAYNALGAAAIVVRNPTANKSWEWHVLNDGRMQFADLGAGATRMLIDTNGNVSANSFITTSDRNAKENFSPVNAQDVLAKVAALPITQWNFKTETAVQHVGPMAQDFRAAFGLGPDEKHIATVDADGVALAAIQGLNEKLEARSQNSAASIQKLETENAALKAQLNELKVLVKQLAEGTAK